MSRISKPASRVLALLMVVCMLIGMLPVSAFAAEGETMPITTVVEDGHDHDHDHEAIDDEQENIEDEEPVIEDEEPVIEDEEPVVEDKESIIDDEWVITDEADVLDADGDVTYTKIDADDIEVGMKIVIVGKGSSNYYALTNGSNQKTGVSVSGDTLSVSGSADALIWTVGTATGKQTDTDNGNDLKYNFSNNGTYMGRIKNENTVTLKGSADANTKYFGHVAESSTIGNYSGGGDYYGLAYSNSQFIYTTGSSNRNISFYEVVKNEDTHQCTFTGAYYQEDGQHYQKCSCGNTSEKVACSGGTATCKDLAVCSTCGKTYGTLSTDHNFVDGQCTVCGTADPNATEEEYLTGEFAKASNLVDGTYIIANDNHALTSKPHDGYTNNSGYAYSGFYCGDVTISNNKVTGKATEDMLFEVEVSDSGCTIKHVESGKYLNATYLKNGNSSYAGTLKLDDTTDVWVRGNDGKLKSTNASKNENNNKAMYLVFDDQSNNVKTGTQQDLFGIRSSGENIDFYLVEEKTVEPPVHEHDWNAPTYTWAEDNASCTAERVCKDDASHKETANATVTSAVKTPATCEEKGTTTYTATFTETWAATQTLDVQDIAAKDHAWGAATYTFAEDGSACTAQRVCGNDATHKETATATITSTVKTEATCTVKGTTTYTATFTETWAATQTKDVQDIAVSAHSYDMTTWEKDSSNHWHECSVCHGKTDIAEHKSNAAATESAPELCATCGYEMNPALSHTHDWVVTYTFAEDGSACTANRVCSKDATHTETATATVTSTVKTPATCEEKGTTTYTATFTETWAETQTKDVVDIAAKNHAWTVTYNFAADGKSCTATHVCGNDAAHNETATATVTSAVKTEATCEKMGTTTYTATFTEAWAETQTKDVQDIATVDHNFENGECTVCGEPDPNYEAPAGNPTKVTSLEDGKYVIVSNNNTKALTSTVHDGYTNTNNYGYKGFNGADVTIANNEITAGFTADMVFEITAKSGVSNGYTIKHVNSGKYLTATYTQNSNGGYNGLLTLTDTAEDTWVLDSNFRLKSTKASDNTRGSTLYLTFDDKTDTIDSGSGSLFGVRSDSNSFTNVDTIDFYKVPDTVTPEPGTKTLRSIAVTTNPTKMTYTVGEDFNPAGMVVTATYSDGTSATVTGYTLSGDQDLTAGSKTITISYTEGGVTKTTTLTVTVNPAGESEDPTNNPTKVTALEDGNYVIVANNMAMTNVVHNGYTNSSSYSYRGFTGASVTISGNEIVAGATDNMIFEVKAEGNGYTIMQNGKYLSASYTQNSNNSGWTGVLALSDTKDIWTWNSSNGYLKSTNASNATSEKDLYLVFDNVSNNVSSGDQNNMFGIRSDGNNGDNMDRVDFYRVGELKQVSSIRVVTAPSKTEYYSGQNFNSSGMVIEVTYEDGTKANITSGFTVDNGSNLTAGQTSVTISYRGKTTTQAITVTVRPEGAGITYVAFSSDVHSKTTSTTSGSPARLNSWITTVTDIIDATFDTMTFCGDNAAGDNSAYGDTYWSYVEPVMSVVTSNSGVEGDGIFLNGNHEWQHGDVGTSSNAVAKKIKPVHYVHEGDDYVIYAFGATSQDQKNTGYKTADITTLGNWLATAPADKPIFIASHFPIHAAGDRSTANAATLRNTLNEYADDLDLYFLWGHNHTNANSSEHNYDKVITGTLENQPIGFTYMAAGCMSDSEYSGGSAAVEGKGLVAKIVDGQVESLTYYGENGNVVYNYEPDYDDDQGGETTVTLSSIAVTTNPTKMVYTQGENFDPAGMVVTATYSDGSKKVVTNYTVSGGTNMAVGTVGITVSYTEGGVTKNATVNVTVNAPTTLVGIAVTTEPTMMVYAMGESFNPAGMVVTATYSDGTTKAVTGYSINGGTNMAIGTNPITISYTEGGVTMVATLNVTVVAAQAVSSIAVTTNPTKMIYTEGESFDPAGMVVTATYADGTSRAVDGYTTADDANMPIGEQTITISYEEGGVTVTTTLVVTVKAPLTGITVNTEEAKMEYADGEAFDSTGLVVTATYSDGTTAEVTEYTVEGGDNMKVGENYITIRYQERGVTKTQELVVTVYAVLTDISVNNDAVKLAYNYGETFDPTGMVVTAVYSDATTKVLEAEDYTITGGTDMVVGENPITVSYTEKDVTITKEFVVTVTAVLKDIEVNTEAVKLAYNYGEAFDPTGLVVTAVYTDDTTIVLEADDYTVTGGTDMKTGENTITISYTEGDVTVTKEFVVTVTAVLTGIEVNTDAAELEYLEGEAFDPSGLVITATYSDGTTKAVTDYTVEGGENMVVGENTITITYTEGDVTQTVTVKVTVKAVTAVMRVAGTSRVDTALEVAEAMKEALGIEKFDTVIIANGEDKNFPDALTGSYLATVKEAPILLYRTSGLSDTTRAYIQNNLVEGGTIYLLGGELAIPETVTDELTAAGYTVKRLAGGSRFDTNLAILKEAGVGEKEILIARGFEFADSLSASATGLPILMVNEVTGKLTDAQIEFLQSYENNKMTILGGTIAVSAELEAAIEEVVGNDVDRVYGTSREATSVAIAERYFGTPEFAVTAYSRKCPDGLCGGPLAYVMGAPLLLINAGQEQYTNDYITEKQIKNGYVLGGTLVITDATARAVFGLAEDAVIEMK